MLMYCVCWQASVSNPMAGVLADIKKRGEEASTSEEQKPDPRASLTAMLHKRAAMVGCVHLQRVGLF
jgi:hypothetical protein